MNTPKIKLSVFVLVSAIASSALTLSGIVTDTSNTPLSGVVVSLVTDTTTGATNAAGHYDLSKPTPLSGTAFATATPQIALSNNQLSLNLPQASLVSVNLIDLKGRMVATLFSTAMVQSGQRISLSPPTQAQGVYIVQITAGNNHSYFKQSISQGRLSGFQQHAVAKATHATVSSPSRTRGTTALDTLVFTKTGYETHRVVVPSLNTPNSAVINVTLYKNSTITKSTPLNGDTDFKLYSPMEIIFASTPTVVAGKSLTLRYAVDTTVHYTIPSDSLTVVGDTLRIARGPYYKRGDESAPFNLKFNKQYQLWSGGAVSINGSDITGKLLDFKTQDTLTLDTVLQTSSTFDGVVNWDNLGDFQKEGLADAKISQKLSAATADNLTGDGVRVAILDEGVLEGSEVIDAVVYQSIAGADGFLSDDTITWYNHGTQMARYMLDYAPKLAVIDLNKSWVANHIDYSDEDLLQSGLDQQADIISLSGSYWTDAQIPDLVTAIDNGLIYAKSLGNNDGQLNDTTDYQNAKVFLPYTEDFTTAKGAMIALQAVLPYGAAGGGYSTIRTHAGHAQDYTLCIEETGAGATSQATATFSGIMALMMEVNSRDNKGYTPRELAEILCETATDIGAPGIDTLFGHGLINIEAALAFIATGAKPSFKLYTNLDVGVKEFLEKQ